MNSLETIVNSTSWRYHRTIGIRQLIQTLFNDQTNQTIGIKFEITSRCISFDGRNKIKMQFDYYLSRRKSNKQKKKKRMRNYGWHTAKCHNVSILPITNNCLQFFDLVILFQHLEIIAQFVFGWIYPVVANCSHFVQTFLYIFVLITKKKLCFEIFHLHRLHVNVANVWNAQITVKATFLISLILTYIVDSCFCCCSEFSLPASRFRWFVRFYLLFSRRIFFFTFAKIQRKNHTFSSYFHLDESHSFFDESADKHRMPATCKIVYTYWTHSSFKRCIVFVRQLFKLNENKACIDMHRYTIQHTHRTVQQSTHSLS